MKDPEIRDVSNLLTWLVSLQSQALSLYDVLPSSPASNYWSVDLHAVLILLTFALGECKTPNEMAKTGSGVRETLVPCFHQQVAELPQWNFPGSHLNFVSMETLSAQLDHQTIFVWLRLPNRVRWRQSMRTNGVMRAWRGVTEILVLL